jgi:thioredoxin-dependent peroxiredoxin
MIGVGERAPDFEARATDGRELRLSDFRGQPVVLYFFPKAFTPGCTTETNRFRDNYTEIRELGAEVIGVSTDGFEDQCQFAAARGVQFPMIGDTDRRISRAYGVLWPLFNLDKRVTFVIDEQGIVRARFHHEFQVLRHLDDVFAFLRDRKRASA